MFFCNGFKLFVLIKSRIGSASFIKSESSHYCFKFHYNSGLCPKDSFTLEQDPEKILSYKTFQDHVYMENKLNVLKHVCWKMKPAKKQRLDLSIYNAHINKTVMIKSDLNHYLGITTPQSTWTYLLELGRAGVNHQFKVVPSICGIPNQISFESVKFPGYFLHLHYINIRTMKPNVFNDNLLRLSCFLPSTDFCKEGISIRPNTMPNRGMAQYSNREASTKVLSDDATHICWDFVEVKENISSTNVNIEEYLKHPVTFHLRKYGKKNVVDAITYDKLILRRTKGNVMYLEY